MTANVAKKVACRSRGTIWVAIVSGTSPRRAQTNTSISGATLAYVPTAPDIFPTAISPRARSSRVLPRASSAYQWATLSPNVIGSACTPWLRPIMGVWRSASARRFSTSSRVSSPARIVSVARQSWTAKAVSTTS